MNITRIELQVKALDILRKELTDEEYTLIETIKIGHSLEELDIYNIKVEAMRSATETILREEREANRIIKDTAQNKQVNNLETYLALPKGILPQDEFTLSVAKFYSTAGRISDKQKAAILKRYTK